MKQILITIILVFGFANSFAQSRFEVFRKDMKKIETQEREYMDGLLVGYINCFVFERVDFSDVYQGTDYPDRLWGFY